jgi:AAA ATPase domain
VGVLGVDGAGAGWWAGRMAGPVGFVGREGELAVLLGALGGDARLVLVVGDAGVGKTRFVAEAADRAAAAGMVLLRGECLPLAEALPLLPVADALGELAGRQDGRVLAGALAAAPGYVRAEVGRLVPGLEPDGGPAEGRGGEWSREQNSCSPAWGRCWPRWRGGAGRGWGWWWRMCTGRTARRWTA